jgi:glycosyltransferase involved in cell wall biosynthesis
VRFNEIAISQFLARCWNKLQQSGYSLHIAGRNPSRRLLSTARKYSNVRIIRNPTNMGLILSNSRILLLPDISGTGMKGRVAEALSYGVPIIGTQYGLRGYTDISEYGYIVNTIDDMLMPIERLLSDERALTQYSLNAYHNWVNKYSYTVYSLRLRSIILNLLEQDNENTTY